MLLLVVSAIWICVAFPRSEEPPVLPAATAAHVERGRYLFEHVLACHDCHSKRDWRFYAGPVVPGTEGGGAWVADRTVPAWSANITQHALGSWTDGEILRAMTAGVLRDGSAVHPLMPWDSYRNLTFEDARSVVAYVRTLPAVDSNPPRGRSIRPKEFLIVRILGRLLPKPYVPPPLVPERDPVAWGKYLATVAECGICHGEDLGGGRQVDVPGTGQTALSANLTPHPNARISGWSEENFVAVFRSFASMSEKPVPARENTPMPWLRYASMSERDLRALYAYLRTLPPVTRSAAGAEEQ